MLCSKTVIIAQIYYFFRNFAKIVNKHIKVKIHIWKMR